MTITRLVALLSVLALLASLPLTVALAQEQAPYTVVGNVMLDDAMASEGTMVVAMAGEDKVGESMVEADGSYNLEITMGEVGAMVMFSLMMGEEGMMYDATAADSSGTMIEVMIGEKTGVKRADLMAFTSDEARPTPVVVPPTKDLRGPRGATGAQGEPGAAGADGVAGPQGSQGNRGPAGADGAPGDAGGAGAAGAKGAAGDDGAAGKDGSDGSKGASGDAGPAGPPGDKGDTGEAGASGGGILAIIALIIAIVGVLAAGGAFIAGRSSS